MVENEGPPDRPHLRPVQLSHRVGQRTERPDEEPTTGNRAQGTPVSPRILQRPPARDAHADHDAGDNEGRQRRQEGGDDPRAERRERVGGRQDRRAVILEVHQTEAHGVRHRAEGQEAERRDAHANHDSQPRAPHDDQLRAHHRDQAVSTNNVARKNEAMDGTDHDHPPAAAADQARGSAASASFHGLVEDVPLHGSPPGTQLAGQGIECGAALTLDRSPGHDHHAEAEQNRKEGVCAAIDEHGAHEKPPLVGARHRIERRKTSPGMLREVAHPEGHVRQGDEGEHEASRDVGRREAHLALSGEGQGGHSVSFHCVHAPSRAHGGGEAGEPPRTRPLVDASVSGSPPSWLVGS